jgi:hypothetical protein
MLEPRDNLVHISAFVDANHVGNIVTCHSTPQQNSTTALCTECTDCKLLKTTKHSWGVNFWKWVCGIAILSGYDCCIVKQASCWCSVYLAINGPLNVFCNNRGVVKNVSIPALRLMKRHNAIY